MTRQQLPRMELGCGGDGDLAERVRERLVRWQADEVLARLRNQDPTLWAGDETEISSRLGWLTLPQDAWRGGLEGILLGAAEAHRLGIDQTILIGMGGSSLAPLVFERVFKPTRRQLRVMDTTHPDSVRSLVDTLPSEGFQFVVSSKSGTTLETRVMTEVLFHAAGRWVAQPGSHFLAITDPGTRLADLAEERGFRSVFTAPSDVGGRFSALSVFGLLPAAMIGIDPERLLRRAGAMEDNCLRGPVSVGLELGATLGECALAGRDKLTLLTSPSVAALPLWIEQLVAESLGKDGKGIVPVGGEPRGDVESYDQDRVFVGIAMEGEEATLARFLEDLSELGHPTIRIVLHDRYDLGAEFFRWEMAVAAAAMVTGVNPFDQPDVEAAKNEARRLLDGAKVSGTLPEVIRAGERERLVEALKTWMSSASDGDYFGILAYLPPTPETDLELAELQRRVRDLTTIATTAGYGPRYLHSTGQLHKGGPNTGSFLQIVPSPRTDFLVPGEETSLGSVIAAQADGDAAALLAAGRRVLRVDVEDSGRQGLWLLRQLLAG
ncbi:MAG: glucose-6-phosphate isomerase [bacterium]|nr:glucose-6-phosphate isomerase [bacterium]